MGAPALPIGGVAAVVGAACWAIKGAAILATGDQPALLFEIAPVFFAIAAVVLARQVPGPRGQAALAAALVALVCSLVAGVSDLVGELLDPAIGLSMLGLLVALSPIGWPRSGSSEDTRVASLRIAFLLGVGTIPAIAVGGALSEIDERLLEVPLVALSLVWAWLGIQMVRER